MADRRRSGAAFRCPAVLVAAVVRFRVAEVGARSPWQASLIAGLYPALRSFASVVAPSEEDPNDLVQEALVRTLRGGPLSRLAQSWLDLSVELCE